MKKLEIKVNGKIYQVEVNEICESAAPVPKVPQPAAPSCQEVPKAACITPTVKDEVISAPMPGKIMAIKVKTGQIVKPGDIILTLEAMKLENEVFSGVTGTVKEIRVCEGTVVNAGDILAIIG